MEEDKPIKGQPKSFFKRLKEGVDDHEEQMAVLGAAVRLGVVIWSGFIITLSYVELPMVKKSATAGDITFVASIFTGALATFGLSTGNGNGKNKSVGCASLPMDITILGQTCNVQSLSITSYRLVDLSSWTQGIFG